MSNSTAISFTLPSLLLLIVCLAGLMRSHNWLFSEEKSGVEAFVEKHDLYLVLIIAAPS